MCGEDDVGMPSFKSVSKLTHLIILSVQNPIFNDVSRVYTVVLMEMCRHKIRKCYIAYL